MKNCAAIKLLRATHSDAHTVFRDRTTVTNANDANARIHAEDISVQKIPAVPLIFAKTTSLARHLPQFVDKVC